MPQCETQQGLRCTTCSKRNLKGQKKAIDYLESYGKAPGGKDITIETIKGFKTGEYVICKAKIAVVPSTTAETCSDYKPIS